MDDRWTHSLHAAHHPFLRWRSTLEQGLEHPAVISACPLPCKQDQLLNSMPQYDTIQTSIPLGQPARYISGNQHCQHANGSSRMPRSWHTYLPCHARVLKAHGRWFYLRSASDYLWRSWKVPAGRTTCPCTAAGSACPAPWTRYPSLCHPALHARSLLGQLLSSGLPKTGWWRPLHAPLHPIYDSM